MYLVFRILVLSAFLAPPTALAQPPGDTTELSLRNRCNRLYANWDANTSAAEAVSEVNPVKGAEMLSGLQTLAEHCLVSLQNDLEAVQASDAWWDEPSDPSETQRPQAQTSRARAIELEAMFEADAPSWKVGATLYGEAMAAPVDYRKPIEYLLNAAEVATGWSDLVEKFAPVVPRLVARMKPWVGLAVDVRDCRALWIREHSRQEEEEEETRATERAAFPVPVAKELSVEDRVGYCLEALQNDVEALEKHLRTLNDKPKNVKVADVSWAEPTLRGSAIGSVQSVEADIDKYLIDSYFVERTKNETWQNAEDETAPGLESSIESIQKFRGLRDLIALLVTTEFALLEMRRDGDRRVFAPEDAKAKTTPTASLQIESEHFGAERVPWAHVSFGGMLAALPALNLLRREPAEDSDQVDPMIYPTFQQAFVWDLNGRVHSQWSERLEVSALPFAGQSILLDDKSLVERGEDFVGAPLMNEAGRAELFYGWLVEARAFDLGLDIIHGESSYLNPRFSIAFGERWNERFVPPDGLGIPEDRWKKSRLFRFRWNIRNTIASRDRYQKPLLVTFSFGLEREWWPGNNALPSVTTLFFSGDFDINKIIKSKE